MYKKVVAALLTAVMCLGFNINMYALNTYEQANITVIYNGNALNFNAPPLVKNGYVFVPIQELAASIGVDHAWDGTTNTVVCTLGSNKLEIPLRNLGYVVNGDRLAVPDDMLPFVDNSVAYVYLDYVIENFGFAAAWNEATNTISVNSTRVERIELGDNKISINLGDTYTLVPSIFPDTAIFKETHFNSKDEGIVSVTDDGEIQAISTGTAIVECIVDGVSAFVTVTVELSINVPHLNDTQSKNVSNWANISSVQQFAYMDKGIAYAYISGDQLVITTIENSLSLEMKFKKLGDVLSDNDGNFYVVWGKDGSSSNEQTIHVSKYTHSGTHVKTIGFVGGDVNGGDGNTKTPFSAGNCSSVIKNGILMVNYARSMYNGHQSNNVIAVNISDMTAYKFEPLIWDENKANIPYVSHSFNQSVIYSSIADDFIFANHGDAYGRGFIVDKLRKEMYVSWVGSKGTYESTYPSHNIFHFYLESNANYNMGIVNKTFAQLGGLAETSRGVALVGASAKSLSDSAKSEKQNLFVQVFNPLSSEITSSMFVGGSNRSGATSTDINDNKNTPLTSVTDYGVRWLTNYTDRDVIAPHIVAFDDKIAILWSTTENDSFYMVLSASGDVLIPETSIDGMPLNSYEQPIYYKGAIYWVSVSDGSLKVRNIDI